MERHKQPAVLIPVKSFDTAKGRLSEALSGQRRAELARSMAGTVIKASGPLPVWVICDDPAVAGFAVANGAGVIWRPAKGLNRAIHDGVEFLATRGVDRVVIAHADLPLATDLAWLGDGAFNQVVIVPDRHGDGTNVMSIPAHAKFDFAYGPGSCAAHTAEANRRGLDLTIVPDEQLGWDVDTADDLAVFDAQLTKIESDD